MTARKLNDSVLARWSVLLIVSFTMMFGYIITDILSPLETMLEAPYAAGGLGWSSTEYGLYSGAYGFFNVFLLMLFVSGLVLDKMGERFTGTLACLLMVVGVFTKYYAVAFVSPEAVTSFGFSLFGGDGTGLRTQVLMASAGFALFGVGCEMVGISINKVMVKWFTGHEIALAMGFQVAMARIGTVVALSLSPKIATHWSLSAPLLVGLVLVCIGLMIYLVYGVMDCKLERQLKSTVDESEKFHVRDILLTLSSRGFWLVTLICLFFYCGIRPFLKFASKLMVVKYGIDPETAGIIVALLPFTAIPLTPTFGYLIDRFGKGASVMIAGTAMLTLSHFCFALPLHSPAVAIIVIIILGVAFSLLPSALWPSIPKIVPLKRLGTAYSMVFYIQNIGLTLVPIGIGYINGQDPSFTTAMTIFTVLGSLGIVCSILLLHADKKAHYGLQNPNI
ncbi:MAG: MFS transporter [Alloprevotella sp.]|nr:MFS transporter [Alloprevotella sp.]